MVLCLVSLAPMTLSTRVSQERLSLRGLIPYWTGIIDVTQHCQYSVPPTWRTDREGHEDEIAYSPDGRTTVQQSWHSAPSWTAYAAHMRRILKPTRVQEDNAQRLWVEYSAGWPGTHTFVADQTPFGVCETAIDVRPGVTDKVTPIVRQIIESILVIQ